MFDAPTYKHMSTPLQNMPTNIAQYQDPYPHMHRQTMMHEDAMSSMNTATPAYTSPCPKNNVPMYASARPSNPLVLRASTIPDDEELSLEEFSRRLVEGNVVSKGTKKQQKSIETNNERNSKDVMNQGTLIRQIHQQVQSQAQQLQQHRKCLNDVKTSVDEHEAVLANHRDAIRSDRHETKTRMNRHEKALQTHSQLMVPINESVKQLKGDVASVKNSMVKSDTKHKSLESQISRIRESFRSDQSTPVKQTQKAYTTFQELQSKYIKK